MFEGQGNSYFEIKAPIGSSRIDETRKHITITPGVRRGKPWVKGIRITVYDVLEYLGAGMTGAQILAACPDLRAEDLRAWLTLAAARECRLAGSSAAKGSFSTRT